MKEIQALSIQSSDLAGGESEGREGKLLFAQDSTESQIFQHYCETRALGLLSFCVWLSPRSVNNWHVHRLCTRNYSKFTSLPKDPSIFPFFVSIFPFCHLSSLLFLTYVFSILPSFLSIYPSIHSSTHLSTYLLSIYFTLFPSCLSSLPHINLFFCLLSFLLCYFGHVMQLVRC